jgi:hypothetical protein
MREKLYLYIGKSDLHFLKPNDPTKIPVKRGEHYTDFDVIEEELPEEFVSRMRDCCLLKMHGPTARDHWEEMESMPVGFDLDAAHKHGAWIVATIGETE